MGKLVDNYSLHQVIGSGVYGKVYKATHISTHQQFAVKVIKVDKFKEIPKLQECTVNEIKTLSSIESSPHIVRYVDMLKTANNYYFVYEFCNGGTLSKCIQSYTHCSNGVMPLNTALLYFSQLLQAFKILAKHNIMHRDLKPDNVLLHNGILKVADFGFCKSMQGPTDIAQTMLGSPIYMAPEVIKGEHYTMKADIWSLGVVFYELLYGYCPFNSSSIAKLIQVLEKQEIKFPFSTTLAIEKLLSRILVKDPSRRIDWAELFTYEVQDCDIVQRKHLKDNPSNLRLQSNKGQGYQRSPLAAWNIQQRRITTTTALDSTSKIKNVDTCHSFKDESRESSLSKTASGFSSHVYKGTLSPNVENQSLFYKNSSGSSIMKGNKPKGKDFIIEHSKFCWVSELCIQVMREFHDEGLLLVYSIQCQLEQQMSRMKQDGENCSSSQNQNSQLKNVLKFVDTELEQLNHNMQELRRLIPKQTKYSPTKDKNRLLKMLANKNIRLNEGNREVCMLFLQLMDYFENGSTTGSSSNHFLNKDQLIATVKSRINKIY